jgi:hypothetical protein
MTAPLVSKGASTIGSGAERMFNDATNNFNHESLGILEGKFTIY